MANVTICDRCGKLEANNMWNRYFAIGKVWSTFGITPYRQVSDYDLCPECNKKLDKFLKGAEIVMEEVND